MNHRERMLAALHGRPADQVPFAPRMDLWQIALRARGTLPERFIGLNTAQIAVELNVACHAVRADYTRVRPESDLQLRGLGMDNHPDYPYRTEVRGLPVTGDVRDGVVNTAIATPAGEVRFQLEQTASMTRDGISLPFVKHYPIRSPDDFPAIRHVFEHLVVQPTPERYAAFADRVGDGGIAVASGPIAASPMHLILHELSPMDKFFYLYTDNRDELRNLAAAMEPYYEAALEALVASPAEVVFWGANYDQDLTWPPFFQEEIAPWLRWASDRLHAAGKLVLTHTDGENQALLPLYPACGFDVAESVCTAPMTRCTLAEVRSGLGEKITIWGGIPSVALLPDSMAPAAFDAFLDGVFAGAGTGEHLILGVSDNVPPDCDMGRLEEISRRAAGFGPVSPCRAG